MKQGIDLKDAIDALTDLIIGKKTRRPTYLPVCLYAYLPAYMPTCLPIYVPT